MSWERARTSEQKEARINEVMAAARRLLLKQGFESVSLSQIASELSFGRTNLYKYFESKEEIYLKLLSEEIAQFGRRLTKAREAAQSDEADPVDNFVHLWTEHLKKEKAMLLLMSLAGNILEKNCSDRILLESKTAMAAASLQSFVPFVQSYFPHLSEEAASDLLTSLIVTANGLFPFCGLNNRQKQLLRKEGLGSLVHEFDESYKHMITGYLRGVKGDLPTQN